MKRKMLKWTSRLLCAAILVCYAMPLAQAGATPPAVQLAWDMPFVAGGPPVIGDPAAYEAEHANVEHHLMFKNVTELVYGDTIKGSSKKASPKYRTNKPPNHYLSGDGGIFFS